MWKPGVRRFQKLTFEKRRGKDAADDTAISKIIIFEKSPTEPSLAASDRRPASKQSESSTSDSRSDVWEFESLKPSLGTLVRSSRRKRNVVRIGLGMLLEEPTLTASFFETLLGGLSRAAAASLPSRVLPPARARKPRVAEPRRLRRRSSPTVPGCGALPALPGQSES